MSVPELDCLSSLSRSLPLLPAYVGPGAGLELGGHFLGLLLWTGAAVAAALLWPLSVLLRRYCKAPDKQHEQPPPGVTATAGVPASEGRGAASNP